MENLRLVDFASAREHSLMLLVVIAHQAIEQPDTKSRSPAPIDLALRRRQSSACDVEMSPGRSVLDEALEKLCGRDRAAPFATGVLHVGDLRVDHLVVFRSKRQPPKSLACHLASIEQAAGKL